MNRRTKLTLAALLVASIASTSTAVALGATSSDYPVSDMTRVVRFAHYFGSGTSASCTTDGVCGESMMGQATFRVPSSGVFDYTLSLSFQYRATGPARFLVQAEVSPLNGPSASQHPSSRVLALSSRATSTTLQFVGHGLQPGGQYYVQVDPLLARWTGKQGASLTMSKVTEEILASPH